METLKTTAHVVHKPRPVPLGRFMLAAVLCVLVVCACFRPVKAGPGEDSGDLTTFTGLPEDLDWGRDVPQVRTVRIPSSADGTEQPALFHDPGAGEERPLLVALHSWSDNFMQKAGIPYARWAVQNGWVFIHPDFRGVNNTPQATVSELAIQDILDALEYAKKNARVDASRVYLVGFSGGAMSALVMVGKHPELWTAVSAWVPVYDLNDWFHYNRVHQPKRHYVSHITASCGGEPKPGSEAAQDCAHRSPSAHLKGARGKNVRVQIAVGVADDYVPPSHSLRAFNALAATEDMFSKEDTRFIDEHGRLPAQLMGKRAGNPGSGYAWPRLFERTSHNATLVLFEGRHDIYYEIALGWLSRQVGPTSDPGR